MNLPQKQTAAALVLLALTIAGFLILRESPADSKAPDLQKQSKDPAPTIHSSAPKRPVKTKPVVSAKTLRPERTKLTPEQHAEIERNKQVDREHMTKLRAGIFAYRAKHGHYPEYLSQLVPEFASAADLLSPQKKPDSKDFADLDHPDPGLEKPSYGYEFSNLEFRDGRTFAEIKEIQRAEWGDAIPLLRCFAYDSVMNLSYGGEIYETALNWEWDAATMDVVDKYGWGPGLTVGEMAKVRVTHSDGSPAAGAQVWADGRNYSFDLPMRPYFADADGWVQIPVGSDVDRTSLVLRAEAPGLASPTIRYANGELPQNATLTLEPSVLVSGVAEDSSGNLLSDARVYLATGAAADQDQTSRPNTVGQILTNSAGQWQMSIHPNDAAQLSGTIGIPAGNPVKFATGQPIDPAAAASGTAVIQVK